MSTWILLRHGESTANAEGVLAGWEDVPLTARGLAQAEAAAEALKALPIGRVLTSDLVRARDTTARVLAAREDTPALVIDPALRERRLGAWARARLTDLRADGRIAVLHGWASRPPGGESHADLVARALPVLAAWEDEVPTLLVAHGGLLRALVGLLDGRPLEEIGRYKVENATPMYRELPPGTWAALARAHAAPPGAP